MRERVCEFGDAEEREGEREREWRFVGEGE